VSLANAMGRLDSNLKLVMVNNGLSGGDIDKVIDSITGPVNASGHHVVVLSREAQLAGLCSLHLQGYSNCYAAAVFHSSPKEGPGGSWNYTIRVPPSLAAKVDISATRNDVEVYGLPLQHAIDSAIASLTGTGTQNSLSQTYQYSYTSETEQQRQDGVHDRYQNTIRSALAVAFFISQIGVVYHLVGFMAFERERGISQLLEALMPNKRRWQPQFARLLS
jgi:ATP-binding cassette, subfamily A (ABC1), member 3